MTSRLARAVGAGIALFGLIVGPPVALVLLVGNPWPGRSRLALGDETALVVGVLAVLVWLVWLRFLVALVVEVRTQLAEHRREALHPGRVTVEPPPARAGAGLLAQRLVATVLLLLPIAVRSAPAMAGGGLAPGTGPIAAAVAAPANPAVPTPLPAPTPTGPAPTVTVATGDTLIGIARTHLGDAQRWREIFDANRDTVQPDGGRLTSPSLIRTGWTLVLPAGPTMPAAPPAPAASPAPATPAAPAPVPYLAPEVVTVAAGDTLWDLTERRLAAAGLPHDAVAVADQVAAVVVGNTETIEDPDLIYVGEQIDLPAVGTPPPLVPDPVVAPDPAPAAPVEAAHVVALPAPLPMPVPAAPTPTPTTTAPATTTTTPDLPAPPGDRLAVSPAPSSSSPSPIGLGEAALLSAGVIALVASRRRMRLRSSTPRARVPEPHPDAVDAERRLRSVDASERLLRVDVAVRAAAATLVHGAAEIAVVRVAPDGGVELNLTAPGVLPPPWDGAGDTWRLSSSTPVELLAEAARTVGAPCLALAQLGVAADGREVLVDLEALGLLAVDAPSDVADAVVHGVTSTLASSVFAEVAHLIGAGIDQHAFLGHRHAHATPTVDDALELAATVVGATSAARQSTFVLRARHTSGEAWEPGIVLVGSSHAGQVTGDVVRAATRTGGGLAVVVAGPVTGAPWTMRDAGGRWVLEPLEIELVPVGLTAGELDALHQVIAAADAELVDEEANPVDDPRAAVDPDEPLPPWSLLVRLLGAVDVVDAGGVSASFERSKALELVAWLTLHRERATRAGARTALWELDVRDATFANVVSEARRAMARLVEPPSGVEWLGRTLTEVLPLHDCVVTDVDIIRRRLGIARLQPPELAIETLRPAVELVRDAPFVGTSYLWPDAEGITSNLVLLATTVTSELAGHHLSMGDIDGVFWATDRGLRVLPGHEELIALRMRAHARAGDLAGVRHEWESYERVLNADPWSDGEPAAKLVLLRRELLAS